MSASNRPALRLAALLTGSGIIHFVAPKFYEPMIPEALAGTARQWVYGSGVAEFAIAAAVVDPRTRRTGGLAAAGFFVAIMPAHVKMTVDARKAGSTPMLIASLVRMPLQIPLVAWALRVART